MRRQEDSVQKYSLRPVRSPLGLRSQVPGPRSQIPDPRSQIPDPRSQIPDPRSQIPDPRSQVPDPRSQIPVSRIDAHTQHTPHTQRVTHPQRIPDRDLFKKGNRNPLLPLATSRFKKRIKNQEVNMTQISNFEYDDSIFEIEESHTTHPLDTRVDSPLKCRTARDERA